MCCNIRCDRQSWKFLETKQGLSSFVWAEIWMLAVGWRRQDQEAGRHRAVWWPWLHCARATATARAGPCFFGWSPRSAMSSRGRGRRVGAACSRQSRVSSCRGSAGAVLCNRGPRGKVTSSRSSDHRRGSRLPAGSSARLWSISRMHACLWAGYTVN